MVDDRNLRDELRVDVMDLAARIGSDKVPKDLLDEAMKIAKSKGKKAARAYIKKVGDTL
jgi:DNA replication protein DnaD